MRTRALAAGITIIGCIGITTAVPAAIAPAEASTAWAGHPDRELVAYTVRRGDSLTGIAVRYHAWTAELASLNHLRTTSHLRIGQHLRVPVVISAKKKAAAKSQSTAARATASRVAHAVAAVKARYTFASARPWHGHSDRMLITHTVARGETPYSIAVRFHAWTKELRAINRASAFRAGQRVTVPIVVSAMRKAEATAIAQARKTASATPKPKKPLTASQMRAAGWRDWTMTRAQIRSLIVRTAKSYGVSPTLALAIAWQESGWHQPVTSKVGAIGTMQLMPGTATWMSHYAGRRLNPRSTRDNVLGGVLYLRYLQRLTHGKHTDQIIAAYYQGTTAIGKKPRWYNDTKRYVTSVTTIFHRIAAGKM